MKKVLSIALIAMVGSSIAFGTDSPASLSKEMFEFKKEASREYYKIQEGCDKIHDKITKATQNMDAKQKEEFYKEFRYQMRQNMAKLGKDEKFYKGICAGKRVKYHHERPGKFTYDHPNCINLDCPAR
ncbi:MULTISPECIES: hypothetical protein [Campylobacter]|uniref:hypothetical protein n=1 Tax=Campylobacter TaxID=194 RepID=UPI000A35619B|nr:hypothetical protein [Campylobacter sp. P0024]MCR8678502.1 hypothetical protein [Campylobacter sp. RM19072]